MWEHGLILRSDAPGTGADLMSKGAGIMAFLRREGIGADLIHPFPLLLSVGEEK